MVTPFAKPQYTAARNSRTPAPVRVDSCRRQHSHGEKATSETWVRPVPLPGSGVMASVFSTIHLGEEGITVIDPGWVRSGQEKAYLHELDSFLCARERHLEDITQVIVTHAHPDHLAAASCLLNATRARFIVGAEEWRSVNAARTGTTVDPYALSAETMGVPAEVLTSILEQRGRAGALDVIPQRHPDHLVEDGHRLVDHGLSEEVDIEALITPGHTPGHLCLVSREQKILLAADMILPEIHPGIGLGFDSGSGAGTGNPVVDYLTSLKRLEEFDDYLIIPGHGYVFTGLRQRRHETAHHVLTRAREVSRVLEWNPDISLWRLASRLTWSSGWDGLRESSMLGSGLRQTMMYRDLVLSRRWSVTPPDSACTSASNSSPNADVNNGALTQWEKTFDLSS